MLAPEGLLLDSEGMESGTDITGVAPFDFDFKERVEVFLLAMLLLLSFMLLLSSRVDIRDKIPLPLTFSCPDIVKITVCQERGLTSRLIAVLCDSSFTFLNP